MIPKIIHYIWIGSKELPELVKKCIESWQKFCPDYEIKFWNEDNLNLDLCPYVRQAYDAKKYAFASDVLRYYVLEKEGGIYLDTDVELVKSLDEFLSHEMFLGFENKHFVNPGLILGVEPHNKHIKNLLEEYNNEIFVQEDGELNLKTICDRSTEYFKKCGLKANNKKQEVDGVHFYPTEYFCPLDFETNRMKRTDNTHSIHWYAASWSKRPNFWQRMVNRFKRFVKRIIGDQNAKKLKAKFKRKKKE